MAKHLDEKFDGDMLKAYFDQDQVDSKVSYNDELRAEADLCAECCSCLRTCCIMSS